MAQLKEDEWPGEGEPTTSEQEGDSFKRQGLNPPGKVPDPEGEVNPRQPIINNADPDQQGE